MLRLACALCLLCTLPARAEPLVVFAAASLGGPLDEVAEAWGHPVTISYAGSAALARQVEAGAPADIVILAHEDWITHLAARGAVHADSAAPLFGNRLALVAETGTAPDQTDIHEALDALPDGARIATGLLDAVPAGLYAAQALTALDRLEEWRPRIVQTENVRVALALAARGEVAAAITYQSDAAVEPAVDVIALVPSDLHDPIRYIGAVVTRSDNAEAEGFLDHLLEPEAQDIFTAYGFEPLP